jgi:hypothetical protein
MISFPKDRSMLRGVTRSDRSAARERVKGAFRPWALICCPLAPALGQAVEAGLISVEPIGYSVASA